MNPQIHTIIECTWPTDNRPGSAFRRALSATIFRYWCADLAPMECRLVWDGYTRRDGTPIIRLFAYEPTHPVRFVQDGGQFYNARTGALAFNYCGLVRNDADVSGAQRARDAVLRNVPTAVFVDSFDEVKQ